MLIPSRNSSAGGGAATRSRGKRRGSPSPGSPCFVVALAIVLTGVDVMTLVEFAVLFSILVLPLTYLPLLLLAGRPQVHAPIRQRPDREELRLVLFRVITAAALAALPLYLLTSGGNG